MAEEEIDLNELNYFESLVISRIRSIRDLVNLKSGEEKKTMINSERRSLQRFFTSYVQFLKRTWGIKIDNPTQYKAGISVAQREKFFEERKIEKDIMEAKPREAIIIDDAIGENQESPRERLERIRKERGFK